MKRPSRAMHIVGRVPRGTVRPVLALAMAAAALLGFSSWCVQAIAADAEGRVLPLELPEGNDPELQAAAPEVYLAAEGMARFMLAKVHPWEKDAELLLVTESRSSEHWIRPNTGAVEGFAFLCRFGPYDAEAVGRSRQSLRDEVMVPMMRYLIATHVTGSRETSDGKRWGDAWQSAHWAQQLGRGAWWTWGDLPDDIRAGVRRVVAHEAERFVDQKPPSRVRHDTKAEENAWNSQIFSVALLLMPDDPRRPAWEAAWQRWIISSFLRPADEQSQTIVDGRPLAEQFTGANIYDDYTLENHGIVHPDYMTTFSLSMIAALDCALSGRKPPEAAFHNVEGVYENLQWFLLPDGGFVYPSGQDWRIFRNVDWIRKHLLMAVFMRHPDGWAEAERGLQTLEKMQARTDTGAVYLDGEFFFASTHADLFRSLAHTWLMLQMADDVPKQPSDPVGVRRLDAAKIILHRTSRAIHSFSWGARTMAMCVPFDADRIVAPHPRSGIGHVRLQGASKPLPIRTVDVRVTDDADSFRAELVLDHGEAVRAELLFRSTADGRWIVSEKLTALEDVTTTDLATGLIGILNHPNWVYENGSREVRFDGDEQTLVALSGKTILRPAVRRLSVDGRLHVESAEPLAVRYATATRPARGRVRDELSLNTVAGTRAWKKSQMERLCGSVCHF